MAYKILVVDDDASIRAMFMRLLTHEGYEPVAAADVPAALHVLTQTAPDLLITDVRLDTYNGLHLIAMGPKPIPAIVLTGFADAGIEADARRLGAEYLVKPVSPATLCSVIARKLADAEHHGVFVCARRWPRTPVTTPIEVVVGNRPAHLIDVSEGGARLVVQHLVGAGLGAAATVVFPIADFSMTADVMWTRRQDDATWTCGVAVRDDARPEWRKILKELS
jgi:CheY-like chemotaxis protein